MERFAQAMGRLVPDAITASILLVFLLFGVSTALGNSLVLTLEAYYQGLWMLLGFTMQMTLIIVLSSVLGSTPFFRKAVLALSGLPRTANQVIVVAALASAVTAYLNWGLNLALGPIIAVHFAHRAERKGIAIDFPFLLAVVWACGAAWQFGLSASAPLLVATPGHFLEKTIGVIPLSTTIFSPAAILHEVAFISLAITAGCLFQPRTCRPVSSFPETAGVLESPAAEPAGSPTFSQRLERSSAWSLALCAALAGWLYVHFLVRRTSLDINAVNTFLLLFSLLLHRNVQAFTKALQQAIVSAWPVVVIYHLYAGGAGLMQFAGVGDRLAGIVASVATPRTFPLLTAAISAVFAVFIPSSGGQWAVQGLITSQAAVAVGVSVQRGILSMGVGDHMGNLISPFWYVIIAAIARVDFRTFFGYGVLFALLWFGVGVVVFTFAPC